MKEYQCTNFNMLHMLNAYLQNLHECVEYIFTRLGRIACKVQTNVGWVWGMLNVNLWFWIQISEMYLTWIHFWDLGRTGTKRFHHCSKIGVELTLDFRSVQYHIFWPVWVDKIIFRFESVQYHFFSSPMWVEKTHLRVCTCAIYIYIFSPMWIKKHLWAYKCVISFLFFFCVSGNFFFVGLQVCNIYFLLQLCE